MIEAYEILFMKADETFVEYTSKCDGSQPDIVAATSCSIPMLEVEPLTDLSTNQQIQVKVRAYNSNGWGAYSEINIVG